MTEQAMKTIDQTGTAVAPVTPMQMLQIAVEQNADLDKLEKLMDLQARWEENEARKASVVAMNAFKKNPPDIIKNQTVSFGKGDNTTSYNHADLYEVTNKIGQALSEHGIVHDWATDHLDGGIIRVTCTLTHEQGHSKSNYMQSSADQSGGKNNIQAIASAITYLQRYTLLAAVGLATQEQDNDGATTYEFISTDQIDELLTLANKVGADKERFCAAMMVPNFAAIHAEQFNRAKEKLNEKGDRDGTR